MASTTGKVGGAALLRSHRGTLQPCLEHLPFPSLDLSVRLSLLPTGVLGLGVELVLDTMAVANSLTTAP